MSDNTAIVTLLVLTLLVLLLLGVVIWAAMKGAGDAGRPAPAKPRLISADSLKQSFRVAVELIENNLAARSERYNLNWTLVLNEGTHGRELPLVQSGLQSALSADSTLTAAGQGISWNFFDQGVAIQLQTEYLGSPDPADENSNGTWDDFLGLCRNYRPDRPFDAIVLSIPAMVFIEGGGQGQLDLIARAKAIHRRLWLAQNRLALRFPIYIAISDCEAIPGFARFAAALPEPLRRSMLGWSSPYELNAPFQAQWVDTAMNDIVRTLSDSGAELCALEPAGSDSSDYFLLPTQVERLRAGLKLFAEELMRPSAYHEPFLLRGMYLTGDCSDAAILLGDASVMPDDSPALDAYGPVTLIMAEADQALAQMPAEPAQDAAPKSIAAHMSAVPAFLRDIFERKIFAETGLVRSSSTHRMRRPALSQLARWSAVAVPVIWIFGMAVASVRLTGLSEQVISSLSGLQSGAEKRQPYGVDHHIDPAKARARASAALDAIGLMETSYMRAIFLPGSWPIFDDVHERLLKRMEEAFADNSFEPLRHEAFSRMSTLTGLALDPGDGKLILGVCSPPHGWPQRAESSNALNVEDMPEFHRTLAYLGHIKELEAAVLAMDRLQRAKPGQAQGADLVVAVKTLLGKELRTNTRRTAEMFREVSDQREPLDLDQLRKAAECTFMAAVNDTAARLYQTNVLMSAERRIAASAAVLREAGPRPANAESALLAWHQLHKALRDEQANLVTGKGAWMHGKPLNLGVAWDNLLERVEEDELLGKAVADKARKVMADGYPLFENDWLAVLGKDSLSEGLNPGLVWSDEANSYVFGENRKALLEALGSLLNQPYMKFNGMTSLPAVGDGSTVLWDGARLDQVLALADVRKSIHSELIPKFPAPLQGSAAGIADAGLMESARNLLALSYVVSSQDATTAPSESVRTRVLRVRGWLEEMNAPAAGELTRVLTADALSRLKSLDRAFANSQVFAPRDNGFRTWNGGKGPLIDAFGAADPAGLASYVGQQQSFIDATGREAESLLLQMGGAHKTDGTVLAWRATVDDLARYRLKSPTSSLMALEQFVLAGAADLEITNCLDKLSARAAQRRGTDVFSHRMQMLQAGLYTRCRELTQSGFEEAWTSFADAFNRNLSNRAPFRPVIRDASLKGERAPAADVEEVRAVLKLFDRVRVLGIATDRDTARPSAPPPMKKVDEQMQRVRDFLAPLYPTEEGQAAGLDVAVEFRANTAAESEGNKIIDWTLTIGTQVLRNRDGARALRWEPGMPVALTLRFAQDGPVAPLDEAGHPGMTVDERTVSYRFDDPWALLSFVSSYREPESTGLARSQLLKFEFPLNEMGGNKITSRDARARVFLRMTMSAAGKRTPLIWPAVFPAKVPEW